MSEIKQAEELNNKKVPYKKSRETEKTCSTILNSTICCSFFQTLTVNVFFNTTRYFAKK